MLYNLPKYILEQILKSLLALLTVSTLLLTNLNAKALTDIYFAGGTCETNKVSENVYEIGYGISSYGDSGVMWGISLNGGMIDTKQTDAYYYGGDFRLGITPIKNFSVYGIGALIWQDFDNGLSGGGFGYGGGAEYRLASWLAIAGEYKTYNMSYDRLGVDENYNSALVKMKFSF